MPTAPLPSVSETKETDMSTITAHEQQDIEVTEIKELPDRGHSLTIDHGRKEVTDTALAFVKQH
jgi:hypothetical protein